MKHLMSVFVFKRLEMLYKTSPLHGMDLWLVEGWHSYLRNSYLPYVRNFINLNSIFHPPTLNVGSTGCTLLSRPPLWPRQIRQSQLVCMGKVDSSFDCDTTRPKACTSLPPPVRLLLGLCCWQEASIIFSRRPNSPEAITKTDGMIAPSRLSIAKLNTYIDIYRIIFVQLKA